MLINISNLAQCEFIIVTLNEFVDVLLKIREDDNESMIPYSDELFNPFKGPFFIPLWKLDEPYRYFSQYGFPDPHKTISTILNSEFQINETLILKKSTGNSLQYMLNESFTSFDLFEKVLIKYAGDTEGTENNVILQDDADREDDQEDVVSVGEDEENFDDSLNIIVNNSVKEKDSSTTTPLNQKNYRRN
ncbi:unnamed protein product [Heterobilharzia americana]|nr:unnamed protein product [Heterobilharzia americana]